DYEEDTEGTSLAVESKSVTTDNVIADKSNFDIELNPFLFNDTSFNQARCNIALSLAADLESENDENEYLVQSNIDANMKLNKQLSACPVLDIIDSDIKCCGSYSQVQRLLAQLVEVWEIDSEIF
ncbi:10348_t:CDS:2, partial [Dentiscutata heterogama]